MLEIINDLELKIYLVLEHVELGEIVWCKEGDPQICLYERQRIERDIRGEKDEGDDEKPFKTLQRRHQRKEGSLEEAGMVILLRKTTHVPAQNLPRPNRLIIHSGRSSRVRLIVTSRAPSQTSSRVNTLPSLEIDIPPLSSDNEDTTVSLS